jgi:hypothetical protein
VGMKDVIDTTLNVNEVLPTIVDDNHVHLLWLVFPRLVTCSYFISNYLWSKHYEERGVLQLVLQFNFWIIEDICNSLYLYVMSASGQVAWVAKLQVTIYMVQFIVTQLQLGQNNSFSTTIQLHYNYTHYVMLMSLIVIHLLKSNMWHYEKIWT